ncbi:MAG: GNAT family N-acetyltransferase, partial [Myxococcales bacterium]|nr:GNAT family N-acetyltransferase [Myxococcales bacterium]
MDAALTVEIHPHLRGVDPGEWDAVVADGCPFFEHAFLAGLEQTQCVGPNTGWAPQYVLARRGGRLVGFLPLYLKADSYGEFIFDWAWADAAHRAGLPYYPKLVAAAPFSPVGGARFVLAPGEPPETRQALLDGARHLAERLGVSGLHLLFVDEAEAAFLTDAGLAIRHTHQFQWVNAGYRTFDDFLARFRSKRRNQIRRERRDLREAGVSIRVVEGEQITDAELAHAWRFYRSTVDKFFYGKRYLNRRFFQHLGKHFRKRILLVLAERDGEVIAGAFNVRKGDTLYGRYWGADEGVRNLHFEVCSYAGIEACIERGIQR